jgi:hypothetical protein
MVWFCSTVFAPTTNFLCASPVLVKSSSNGSPLESNQLGDVVATITKKRRGNESNANFEINVGEGRYISLNDPTGLQALDSSMKATAASQLMVLQDQMASLMAQLTK